MVGREIKIERRVFTIKQGKKGPFEVLTFEEHRMNLGSLTIELTFFLSNILHNVADYGTSGKNYWSSADMMYWIKIHKRSNMFGETMQVSWARRLRFSGKMTMEIPGGAGSVGWKRFAIALDSLNPNTKNWGDDVVPSAYFAGRTRAYNDPYAQPLTTTVDALGQLDTLGEWRSGIICNRPVTILTWQEIGRFMSTKFNITTPFELLPLDEFRAVFFMEEQSKRSEIMSCKGICINNWTIGFTAWAPHLHKITPFAQKKVFWISLVGVPLNLWTPEIIKTLSNLCGEFLSINSENLNLEEITSIKVKVRNDKGPNSIPRVLKLQTPEGDFEILVNILLSGLPSPSPMLHRVMINEEEDNELDADLGNNADVDLSEETISDNWTSKIASGLRIIKNVFSTPTRFHATANVGESYTTLTNSQIRTRKKTKRGQTKKKQKRKDKVEDLVHKQRRWVPKVRTNLLGARISNSILNTTAHEVAPLELASQDNFNGPPQVEAPQLSYLDALLKVPQAIGPYPSSSTNEGTSVKGTYKDTTFSNSQALALRRLQVGLEVGMSVSTHGLQALELIKRNIRRDEEAAENFSLKHHNPDIYLTQGELLVKGDSDSDHAEENGERYYRTPLAPFLDPIDSWSNSFLQADYSKDSDVSISIPPGFADLNNCSLRSLKTSIKNHQKNKMQQHNMV